MTSRTAHEIDDNAFICTSFNLDVALNFAVGDDGNGHGVVLEIHQQSGRYIQPYVANQFKHQEELLLFPGTVLVNRGAQWVSQVYNGKNIQYLKVYMVEQPAQTSG